MAWFKMHEGAHADIKWPVIARRADASRCVVLAVWWALLDHASSAVARGDVSGFDPETIDALYDLPDGTCARVCQAMAEKGLVRDGQIVNWDKRQVADPTARERKDRYRTRATGGNGGERSGNGGERSENGLERKGTGKERSGTEENGGERPDETREEERRKEKRREERRKERREEKGREEREKKCEDEKGEREEKPGREEAEEGGEAARKEGAREPDGQKAREPDEDAEKAKAARKERKPASGKAEEPDSGRESGSGAKPSPRGEAGQSGPAFSATDCVVITLPLRGGIEYGVTRSLCLALRKLHPGVDIDRELRAMRDWLARDASRPLPPQRLRKFMSDWMARHENADSANGSPRGEAKSPPDRQASLLPKNYAGERNMSKNGSPRAREPKYCPPDPRDPYREFYPAGRSSPGYGAAICRAILAKLRGQAQIHSHSGGLRYA